MATFNFPVYSKDDLWYYKHLTPTKCIMVGLGSIRNIDLTPLFEEQKITAFNDASEWMVIRTTKKGRKKQIDLKEIVLKLKQLSPETLKMQLKMTEGTSVKPADVIQSIFQLADTTIRCAEFIKEKQNDTPVS